MQPPPTSVAPPPPRLPSPVSPNPPTSVQLYERLQRWRYRQHLRWPGLFQSLTTSHLSGTSSLKQPQSDSNLQAPGPMTFKMTARMQQDHTVQIYINNILICICDGCGALVQLKVATGSSDSTVSPPDKLILVAASSDTDEIHHLSSVRCDQCGFTTPLGTMRRMLCLPSCGPAFAPTEAFALLVEAVSVPVILQTLPAVYRSWFLDPTCRTKGLDALLSMLGLRDEFLINSEDPLPQVQSLHLYAELAERALYNRFTLCPEFPHIPFSVSTLLSVPISDESHKSTIEDSTRHAAALISEAQRLCKIVTAQNTHRTHIAASLFRIRSIAAEYQLHQIKVRLHNHVEKPFPVEAL